MLVTKSINRASSLSIYLFDYFVKMSIIYEGSQIMQLYTVAYTAKSTQVSLDSSHQGCNVQTQILL